VGGDAASEAAGENMTIVADDGAVGGLAAAVVEQAVRDYRSLAGTTRETKLVSSQRLVCGAALRELEEFFTEEGGAQQYLDLVGSSISPYAILTRLQCN